MMSDTTEEAVLLEHVTKTYPGVEQSLRGTKLEWKGPALWLRNLLGVERLTSNKATPVEALHDLSLRVQPGEIFGLVGPNGSGKTTPMKIVAGLLQPTSGTGSVAGSDLKHTREIRRKVSYVSTTGWMGLEWPLTAEENIRFFATLCGMPTSLARVRTEEALHAVNLWEDRQKYPSQLSNGMRQRVILARALLFHTPLILLDEPTVGLDPIHTQLLNVLSNAGLGLAGVSLFFLLEVKSGQDPITWAYRYLVMLASGLYVPLSVLPGWLRGLSSILPQTYGLAVVRALVLTGVSWNTPQVWENLLPLVAATLITLSAGYAMLSIALRRAERGGGIGVVV